MKKGIAKGESQILSATEMKELENLILKSKDKHIMISRNFCYYM